MIKQLKAELKAARTKQKEEPERDSGPKRGKKAGEAKGAAQQPDVKAES